MPVGVISDLILYVSMEVNNFLALQLFMPKASKQGQPDLRRLFQLNVDAIITTHHKGRQPKQRLVYILDILSSRNNQRSVRRLQKMNTLYNSALRQGTAIRKDLDALADGAEVSPALLGQINASLTSFSRTVDDYNKLAKQELVAEKQQKAYERIKNFRSEQADYRDRFDRLKKEAEERQTTQARTELLGRRPHHAATPENPYANIATSSSNPLFQGASPGAPSAPNVYSAFGSSPLDANRETHALREQSFFQKTHEQIDEFLERGSEVLGSLGQQRDILKGTQRKLYSVGNTLGISGDTIRMVERRAMQDKWIFYGGVIAFFVFAYFVIRWLR